MDIQSLPKISLHDHLDGGLRPQTIVELADGVGHKLPAESAVDLANWFSEVCNSGSLVKYLEAFDHTVAVMQTREGLERVERAMEEISDRGGFIRTGQLVTAMRHADRGLEIAELAVRHRNNGVVGFDIAGAEKGFLPSRHKVAFDYLASELFPVTVHAGEADGVESIKDAIVSGRALRLGHGVRLIEDIMFSRTEGDTDLVVLGPVAQWVHDREIVLETSPSSNLQTGAFAMMGDTMGDHPFDVLYDLGFKVTVNTDNRLMSGTSLTRELEILVDTFGYTIADLEQFQLNAAQAAFQGLPEREELMDMIELGFARA
ncbi:MAG: adenosine deaminase family protein [Aquiluna sp.]